MKFVGIHQTYPDQTGERQAAGGKRLHGTSAPLAALPLVTIITVCFNSAKTIEGTFSSIRRQTYANIEYIVIDGGSRDGTVDLLKSNEDLIDYFVSEPDKGLYHAMNKGLSLASGQFVLILNSDDWYEDDTVEKLVDAHRFSGCDFVGGQARYVNADGSSFVLPSMRYDHATLLRMPLRHQTMLIPAWLYDEIGLYDENYPIIADFEFTVRLYLARKSYFEISKPLLNFRTTGVSSTALDRLHMEHKSLLFKVFPFLTSDEAELIFDHSALTPEVLLDVAASHCDQPDFVLAARDMIADFKRIWDGKWGTVDPETFERACQPEYPKISVVIPVHNAQDMIASTLLTLLDQNFQSFEAICINDCSSDNSSGVIREIANRDARVRLIDLPRNLGPGGARNAGIRAAHGAYVFFLDADDALMPGALSRLYKVACANNSDIVRGAFKVARRIHGRATEAIKYPADVGDREIATTTLAETPALLKTTEGHWACLYDRSFVETILYPEGLSMGEDSLFLIHALTRAKKISTIPDVVYFYQDNDASAMNAYTFKKYMDEVEWRYRAFGILQNAGAQFLADYFLYSYWDLSMLRNIPERLTTDEAASFFCALRDAFGFAGGAVADRCSNGELRREFELGFSAHGLSELAEPLRKPLTVAILSSSDTGGAGIASVRYMKALRDAGHGAFMISIFKRTDNPNIFHGPLESDAAAIQRTGDIQALWDYWHSKVALTKKTKPKSKSRELFSTPNGIVDNRALGKAIAEVDLIHLHWVVGMLDYPELDVLIGDKPVLWTLHDMNAFTGGCHYSEGCDRYLGRCDTCPLLEPGSTHAEDVLQIKKEAISKIRNLHIICPSQWLADRVAASALLRDRAVHVIPNFIPVTQFVPTNKVVARMKLGIPPDRKYIVFGADSLGSKRKGGYLLAEGLDRLNVMNADKNVEVLFFGSSSLNIRLPVHNMGYVHDPARLSLIYAAADVFAFPSLEDNAPQTVVEALLSGTPVVGFPVGNMPELVSHKKTGYIAHYADVDDFAQGIAWALDTCAQPEGRLRGIQGYLDAYSYHEPKSLTEKHIDLLYSIVKASTP